MQWTRPRVWRRFGVADQASANTIRPMAYNQGFYNLFLAVGVVVGLVLFWVGGPTVVVAGRAVALFGLGAMAAAAVVLATGGRRYRRPALIQGILPLVAVVLLPFA